MKIISRNDARAEGLTHYFTGKPCKRGHIATRNVSNAHCNECHKERMFQWGRDNAEANREKVQRWRDENRDRSRESARRYRKENPEATQKTLKKRRERLIAEAGSKEEFYKKHYDKYRATFRESSAMRRMAQPPWVDRQALREIYDNCPEGFQVDHIIPLMGIMPDGNQVCGLHVPWNLQYLPTEENYRKKNKVQLHEINDLV